MLPNESPTTPLTLGALVAELDVLRSAGDLTVPIRGITHDSRAVRGGELFVAVAGLATDGHRFIDDAVAAGAVAVVAQQPPREDLPVAWVRVADTRSAIARLSACFFGHPSAELRLVGVTGTNGKTTVCYLIESIVRAAGRAAGVIGTVNVRVGGEEHAASLTTPEAPLLHRILRQMRDAGVTDAAMEVSSHAIDLRRPEGCRFTAGVLTNLSQDHLDYHGDLASYAAVKARFLVEDLPEGGLARGVALNIDDPLGRQLAGEVTVPLVAFSVAGREEAAVRATTLETTLDGVTMDVQTPRGALHLCSRLLGRHNAENILAAVAAAEILELPHGAIITGVRELSTVPGRLEPVPNDHGFAVLVDYAHTDDALANVTRALRPLTAGRLITVFGCGGDRDRTKRPAMGAIAVRQSDIAVVTSDNPRTEDPQAIVDDILPGVREAGGEMIPPQAAATAPSGVLVELNRERAIHLAVAAAQPGDTVLVAGKGHEDYQIIGTRKRHFDDREVLAAALSRRRGPR